MNGWQLLTAYFKMNCQMKVSQPQSIVGKFVFQVKVIPSKSIIFTYVVTHKLIVLAHKCSYRNTIFHTEMTFLTVPENGVWRSNNLS